MPQVVQAVPVARAGYFDRNADVITRTVSFAAGAHVPTLQLSYTVPPGRNAFIEVFFAQLQRNVAAASLGNTYVQAVYTPNGGTSINFQQVYFLNNTLLAAVTQTITQFGFLAPGDNIGIYTANGDTGGNVSFMGSFKGTEFEA